MLRASQILASRIALAASLLALGALAGCGQRGPLFLPGDVPASDRATLPQTLGLDAAPQQQRLPGPVSMPVPALLSSVPAAPAAPFPASVQP